MNEVFHRQGQVFAYTGYISPEEIRNMLRDNAPERPDVPLLPASIIGATHNDL